jgi:hypothetical protein
MVSKKTIFASALFIFSALSLVAQPNPDSALKKSPPLYREYQFSLPEPAKQIELIEYEKDKVPLHGKLSPDGKIIYIRNYKTGQMVRAKVLLQTGKTEEYIKSPCFIDPVIEAL